MANLHVGQNVDNLAESPKHKMRLVQKRHVVQHIRDAPYRLCVSAPLW